MEKDPILKPVVYFSHLRGSKPLCRSPEKRACGARNRPVLAIGPQQTVDNNTVLAKGDNSYRYQHDDIN